MKILTIGHYHPHSKPTGSANAAYAIAKELLKHGHESYFLGGNLSGESENAIHKINNFDYMLKLPSNVFLRSKLEYKVTEELFYQFVEKINPDIIHFHTIHSFGMNIFDLPYKDISKHIKLIYTLHNYIPICLNNGWMMHTYDKQICYEPSIEACQKCFPSLAVEEISIHEKIVKNLLDKIDLLITPSFFARNQYMKWGINADKICRVSNALDIKNNCIKQKKDEQRYVRLGYFGQIGVHKGLDVLLESLSIFQKNEKKTSIKLDIYGSNLNGSSSTNFPDYMKAMIPKDYTDKIFDYLKELEGIVTFHGEYDNDSLGTLMETIDWVIVPSIQYENQPLVIMEAFLFKTPVICSDIGGMKEMVKNLEDGLLFEVGNPNSLYEKLVYISNLSEEKYQMFVKKIIAPPTITEIALEHLSLYRKIMS